MLRTSLAARILCALLLTAATRDDATTQYRIAPADSEISAKVAYFGLSSIVVRFPEFTGSVKLDPARPEAASVDVVIDARSLTAPDGFILDNLKGENFFWVERYPDITFVGNGLMLDTAGQGTVSGTLTARGISRPTTLTVSFAEPLAPQSRPQVIDLVGQATIDRRDFGMTSYPLIVGNSVKITINAHLVAG